MNLEHSPVIKFCGVTKMSHNVHYHIVVCAKTVHFDLTIQYLDARKTVDLFMLVNLV